LARWRPFSHSESIPWGARLVRDLLTLACMNSPVNVFGVSHVDLPVADLTASLSIYRDLLGFTEKARAEGCVDLDAGGTITIRLVSSPNPEHRASLRIHTQTVETLQKVLLAAGCRLVHEPLRTPDQCLQATVLDRDAHTLYLWRPLSEDEYDFVPTLPTQMTWEPSADLLLKSLLKSVPALFRSLARWKVVRCAEDLASASRTVTREEVIRGFILASPRVTRGRNRQPLIAHGVDVDLYDEDWKAD